MKPYKKTPQELFRTITLFSKQELEFNLFKCEHIFEGKNSNLDILFKTTKDFKQAGTLLKREGYLLYMSEKVEKYKEMWVKVENTTLYAIHLHREVAWHNLKILDKEGIFKNQIKLSRQMRVPRFEEQLLIHCAHIIFENFTIRKREEEIIKSLLGKDLDWGYIKKRARKHHFYKSLRYICDCVKKKRQVSKLKLYMQLLKNIILTPTSWPFILGKIIKSIVRRISLTRKGTLVSLIGIQGAGKTTLTRHTLERYEATTQFFHGQQGYYYGWRAFSPHAKFLSWVLKKRKERVFDSVNSIDKESNSKTKEKRDRFSLKKELLFLYIFIEYYLRYLIEIYPKLRKGKLVLTDRYFYDTYAQYRYADYSKILPLLLRLFPKPNKLFVLEASTKTVMKRDKDPNVFAKVTKSSKRSGMKKERVEMERKRFRKIAKMFNGVLINSEHSKEATSTTIIQESWRGLVS